MFQPRGSGRHSLGHESGRAGPGFSDQRFRRGDESRLDGCGKLRPRLEALIRVLTHGLEDHLFQALVRTANQLRGQRQRFVEVLHDDGERGIGVEWDPSGYDLIQNDPQRVDVAPAVTGLAHALLG